MGQGRNLRKDHLLDVKYRPYSPRAFCARCKRWTFSIVLSDDEKSLRYVENTDEPRSMLCASCLTDRPLSPEAGLPVEINAPLIREMRLSGRRQEADELVKAFRASCERQRALDDELLIQRLRKKRYVLRRRYGICTFGDCDRDAIIGTACAVCYCRKLFYRMKEPDYHGVVQRFFLLSSVFHHGWGVAEQRGRWPGPPLPLDYSNQL